MKNKELLQKIEIILQDGKVSNENFEELKEIIELLNKYYYENNSPLISDFEYDKLFEIFKNSPKYENLEKVIGSDFKESSFEKVAHSRPMISLDNTYDEKDLFDFDERVRKRILEKLNDESNVHRPVDTTETFTNNDSEINSQLQISYSYNVEFKFDGLGLELIYENGIFQKAITRGDGTFGEDVTENARTVANIPKEIPYKNYIEIRGEIVLPISEFERINKENLKNGEKVFSNPRNAASGSLRTKKIETTKKRNLKFFGYDIANLLEIEEIKTYKESIKFLENLGFETSSYFKNFKNISELSEEITSKNKKDFSADFDIDGLVLKVDEINLWQKIGFTAHHPRYAIAYKFPAEIVKTRILSVQHSIGRTGTITPVGNLEPVFISGAKISRVTMHNYEEVENLDLRVGDYIFLKRAGEVIPDIVSVISEARDGSEEKIISPEFCPSCGSQTQKEEGKVRIFCPNKFSCPAQKIGNLVYFVSKSGLNIDGFGEKQIEEFYKLGFIYEISDIFELEKFKEEILKLEGFAEKSVSKLFESIEKSKNQKVETFLTSLGIEGIGKKTAKNISFLFNSKEDFLNFNISFSDFGNIPEIGNILAENIIKFFENAENKKVLEKLLFHINLVFPESKKSSENFKNLKFSGKKFCVTGSFENISREEIIAKIEENGGEFVSSVSKKTDFLIVGEKAGSKLQKALELGIEVFSLEDLEI